MMRSFAFLAAFLVTIAVSAQSKYDVLPADGIPWNFPETSGGTIAIGDIHGDAAALIAILRDRGLVNEDLKWSGGNARLVLTGDLVDRGPETRRVMDLILLLTDQASNAGGSVHTLIGNHEMMVTEGDLRYVSPEDARAFADFGADPLHAAFTGTSPYARWIGSRNSMIRVGRTLFVHAGLEKWRVQPGELNATVRAWLRFHQGEGAEPPRSTAWVAGDEGPLWTRTMAVGSSSGEITPKDLADLLAFYDVDRVVMGHSIQEGLTSRHPKYGANALFIDTGISRAYNGLLSSIKIKQDRVDLREIPRFDGDPVYARRLERKEKEVSWTSKIGACFRAVVGR